jgi:hypothetical protein
MSTAAERAGKTGERCHDFPLAIEDAGIAAVTISAPTLSPLALGHTRRRHDEQLSRP